MVDSHRRSWREGWRSIRLSYARIIALFVLTILGMLLHTILTFERQRSEGVVIDLAGRQRMLNARHLQEILLVSQGLSADYRSTREVLHDSLAALTHGGVAVRTLGKSQTVSLPPVPTDAIRQKLEEQKRLIDAFSQRADEFLQLTPTDERYSASLDELRALNEEVHTVADDAVRLLAAHSWSNVTTMLGGQIVVAFVVGILGVWLTRQVIRANRDREREMTERQRAETDLRKSQAQMLEAVRQSDALKSALLSSVSHELRTPLTAIKSMVARTFGSNARELSPCDHEDLNAIDRQIDHLTRLVENLLDMSRIEAGILKPKRDWELLEDLVEGAMAALDKPLRGRRRDLEVDDDVPPFFIDGVQIHQVLVNLLDNAVKYSPEGSPISLTVRRAGDAVEVRVRNSGEPIPPHDLERVFDRFYRASTGRAHTTGGTGLGLAICKGIVDAHGGRIWAESAPGGDTTFAFTLPIDATPVREPAVEDPFRRAGQS